MLWTNSAPTSEIANGTTFSLSDDMTNYKYLKLTWRRSTTDSTECNEIMSVDDFLTTTGLTSGGFRWGFGMYDSSSVWVRTLRHSTNTAMIITKCAVLGGTSTENKYIIPTKISGLK